jgi:transposase
VTAVTKVKPQVIDDEQHEQVYERVAAVDVAKDSGMVCTRMPHPSRPGARQSAVWTVTARMAAVGALGRQLKRDGIEMVTLESTSDYWRIWLRREAPCCIPGLAGRDLEDIPGSDGLLKIRKVKGTTACQETSGRANAYGRRAGGPARYG